MAQEPDPLTHSGSDDDAPPEAARIERDIERTRSEMSETIDAIGARFQPAYLREQAKDAIRDTARDAGTSMIDTIRDNPLPAAIAGLSIAWLVANGGRSSTHDRHHAYDRAPRRFEGGYGGYDDGRGYGPGRGYDRYGAADHAASHATDHESLGDRAGQALDTVRDRASGVGEQIAESAHTVQEQVGDYGRRTAGWLEDQMDRNPLGVGAVALAAGALVGLSLPGTEAENELMGRQSQAVGRQVSQVANEKIDQFRQVASTVVDDVKEKAGEVVEHAKSEAKDLSASGSTDASSGQSAGSPSSASTSGGGSASGGSAARPFSQSTSGSGSTLATTDHVANVNHPDGDETS